MFTSPLRSLGLGLAALALCPTASALSSDALDALRTGDCSTALASVDEAVEDAERLALARCAVQRGQADQALGLVPTRGSLSTYGDLVAAEALLLRGDALAAAMRLEGKELPGEAGQRARLMEAQAWIQAGRAERGRDLLRPLLQGAMALPGYQASPTGADPAEARWWLAENAVVRGEVDAAVPVWQSIWSKNPTSTWAEKAAARLAEQGRPVPDPSTPGGRALMVERRGTFKTLNLYVEALELHDLLPAEESQAGLGYTARLAFQAKDYPRAVSLYDRLSSPSADQRFSHALATSRTSDYARASELYGALIAAEPGSSEADEASYKLGYLHYDAGELALAIPKLEEHLRRFPRTRFGDSTRWFIAWSHYRLGHTAEAEAAFKGLGSNGTLAPQARYWLARMDEAAGRGDAARQGYEEVLRRWPFSGPAWFAADRLGRTWAPRPLESLSETAWDHPAIDRGRSLARVGLAGWAQAELDGATSAAKATGSRDALLVLAQARFDANDFPGARALAQPYCTGKRQDGPVSVAEQLCWPRPHGEQVMLGAGASGLDPQLPFGIMNAESGMRPEVTSPAGARGLMQLMPELARGLHEERFGARPYHPDALYQPVYNATLGTDELAGLSRSLEAAGVSPHMPAAIAGYNGGEAAVRRWLEASGTPVDADVWSENIGYTETRLYVRRVLGYLMRYRQIYGDPPVPPTGG